MAVRTVMGFDPGSKSAGWGIFRAGKLLAHGVYTYGPWPYAVVLPSLLVATAVEYRVTELYYEHTGHHVSTAAAHSHGESRACVFQAARVLGLQAQGVMYSTIKKVATGNGRAKKPIVVEACTTKFGLLPRSDDVAEGIWCAWCGWIGDLGDKRGKKS